MAQMIASPPEAWWYHSKVLNSPLVAAAAARLRRPLLLVLLLHWLLLLLLAPKLPLPIPTLFSRGFPPMLVLLVLPEAFARIDRRSSSMPPRFRARRSLS